MTEEQKKTAIIVGGIGFVLFVAYFLSRNGAVVTSPTATGPTPLAQYTANIPPYQPGNVSIPIISGGVCCNNDGCFTAGQQNTGNAPTSIDQLIAWYSAGSPGFSAAVNSQANSFNAAPQTIIEMTNPASQLNANVIF